MGWGSFVTPDDFQMTHVSVTLSPQTISSTKIKFNVSKRNVGLGILLLREYMSLS